MCVESMAPQAAYPGAFSLPHRSSPSAMVAAAALAALRQIPAVLPHYQALKAHLVRAEGMSEDNYKMAFSQSAFEGHLPILRYLIDLREPIIEDLWDAIILAAREGHLDVMKRLIAGREFIYEHTLESAVTEAVSQGHMEIVLLLLRSRFRKKINLDWPLRAAIHCGNLEVCKLLIHSGHHLTQEAFRNLLLFASGRGQLEILRFLLKLEIDDLVKRYDVGSAFQIILHLRSQLISQVFHEYANQLIEKAPLHQREGMIQQVIFGALRLPFSTSDPSRLALPQLPVQSRLVELKAAIDRIDLSSDQIDPTEWIRWIDEGYVGSLFQELDFPVASLEEYEALTLQQKQLLSGRFRTYGFHPEGEADHSYAHYQSCCLRAKENYRKLRFQLRDKMLLGDRSSLGELGTPNPVSQPSRCKAWYQQIYEHLTYLENYRRKINEEEQESLILQILTSTAACAGRTQATLSELFTFHVQLSLPHATSLLDQHVTRHLIAFHHATVWRVKSLFSIDVHFVNDIDGVLSRFGLVQMEQDGLRTAFSEDQIITTYQLHYDRRGLVAAIVEELNQNEMLMKEFLSHYRMRVPSEEEYQGNIQLLASDLINRWVQHGFGGLNEQEQQLIDPQYHDSAYRKRWQAQYAASARADVPTVENFIAAQRAEDAADVLEQVKANRSFQERCDEQLDLMRWPLDRDRTIKPHSVMQYLIQRGFFS